MRCPIHRRTLISGNGNMKQQVLKCIVTECTYTIEITKITYKDRRRSLGKLQGRDFMQEFNKQFGLKAIRVPKSVKEEGCSA